MATKASGRPRPIPGRSLVPYAAAISEHPLATHAVAEVVGQVIEKGGPAPDLAVLFVTTPHVEALEEIGATVRRTLNPTTLMGTTACGIAGNEREVEDVPAVSLWAAWFGPVSPMRIDAVRTNEGIALNGFPPAQDPGDAMLLLLADPFTFPVDGFVRSARTSHPDMRIVGGLASAARGPGGNRLLLNDRIDDDGAVGVLIPADRTVGTVVSQGCRPVGEAYTVTRSDGNRVYELGGQPAVERIRELIDTLPPEDRELLERGLHLGLVRNEQKLDFERGDFIIRAVMGIDKETGAIVAGDFIEVGATVQFQIRDAASADEDLRELMNGRSAASALMFTCNGRGEHLFGSPNHDAAIISGALQSAPLAGMFCAGELGPIGDENLLHGFTASIALFRD